MRNICLCLFIRVLGKFIQVDICVSTVMRGIINFLERLGNSSCWHSERKYYCTENSEPQRLQTHLWLQQTLTWTKMKERERFPCSLNHGNVWCIFVCLSALEYHQWCIIMRCLACFMKRICVNLLFHSLSWGWKRICSCVSEWCGVMATLGLLCPLTFLFWYFSKVVWNSKESRKVLFLRYTNHQCHKSDD